MAAKRHVQLERKAILQHIKGGIDSVPASGKELLQPTFASREAREAADAGDALALPDTWTRDILGGLGGKAITTADDPGLVTPDDHTESVFSLPFETGIAGRVNYFPVNRNGTAEVAVLDQDDADLTGSVQMTWRGAEDSEVSENEPTFTGFDIECHPLEAYIEVSNVMLNRSAVDLEQWFKGILQRAAQKTISEAFLTGSGTGEPLGVINTADVRTVAREGAGAVSYQDSVNLKHAPQVQHRRQAAYTMHDDVEKWFEEQTDGDGRPLFVPDVMDNKNESLNGRDYFIDGHAPDVGNDGDMVFGDWSQYAAAIELRIALRRSTESPEVFRRNRTAFIAIMSVGGRVFNPLSFAILSSAGS